MPSNARSPFRSGADSRHLSIAPPSGGVAQSFLCPPFCSSAEKSSQPAFHSRTGGALGVWQVPYFKREPTTLASDRARPSPLATAESRRAENPPVESAVVRALAILDDELRRQGKWPAIPAPDIGEYQVKRALAGIYDAVAPDPCSLDRGDHIPALPVATARRGDTTTITVTLANDLDSNTDATFVNTGLVSNRGHVLNSDTIAFAPVRLSVPPHGEEVLTIHVTIPATAPVDRYSGLLILASEDPLLAVVTLEVI